MLAAAERHGDCTALERARAGEHGDVVGRALEELREQRREPRCVELGRRVDEYEVGVVRAREPHQVGGRGVARERRRPRFRPVRTDRGGRGRQLVLSRNEPCHDELGPHEGRDFDERADAIVARRRDEDHAGARRRRRGSELERGVVREDRPLERLQRRGRIEPEGLDQEPPRRTVDLQRFRLSSGAVEREHQLAAGPLAQRMLCDERLELGHERRSAARARAPPRRGPPAPPAAAPPAAPQRLARTARTPGRRGEVPARGRAPRRAARPPQHRRARIARSASAVRRSKRARSSSSVAQPQQVAGRPRLDRVGRVQRAPQLRDLSVHLGHRRDRRAARIELVGEPLDRHDAVCVQQQDRERRALPRAAEPDRAVVADDLERAQEAELEHRRDGSRSVATR